MMRGVFIQAAGFSPYGILNPPNGSACNEPRTSQNLQPLDSVKPLSVLTYPT
jgi:hypothetical protein